MSSRPSARIAGRASPEVLLSSGTSTCRAEAVGAELAHIDVESSPILHIRYKAGGAFRMLITDARYAPEEWAGRPGHPCVDAPGRGSAVWVRR